MNIMPQFAACSKTQFGNGSGGYGMPTAPAAMAPTGPAAMAQPEIPPSLPTPTTAPTAGPVMFGMRSSTKWGLGAAAAIASAVLPVITLPVAIGAGVVAGGKALHDKYIKKD